MSGVLIDSDVLIDVLRDRKGTLIDQWIELANSDDSLYCSPVSVAEIWHGMREQKRHAIERLFSVMTCLPIGEEVARKAGDYLRSFHKSHGLQLADGLIAATASLNGLALWTRNRRHFPMRDVLFFGSPRAQ